MTKILLVEDDKSLREIYGVRLLAEGYQITSAGDGEEALAMAVKERPDLIISDVMMPKISGFDMLDILRSTPETKDIKVIMMTALSSEDQRTRGESLGANRYLVKSQVGIEDVVRTVHDILADSPVAATPAYPIFNTTPTPLVVPTPQPTQQPSASAPIITDITPPSITPISTTPATPPYAAPKQPPTTNASQPQQPPIAALATSQPTQPAPIAPSQLPQPTAPFSTSPQTYSTSNVEPTAVKPPTPDIATLISQELNDSTTIPPISTPQL
jgi:CheY-like chemotaxis protein